MAMMSAGLLGLFTAGTAQDIGEWKTTTALPEDRVGSRAEEWNGTIYVTGGRVSGAVNTVYRGDINADGTVPSWTQYTMDCYKERHASVAWNDKLYVMAGLDEGGSATSSVYFANISGDGTLGAWTATTSLPGTRYDLAATVYNGYIYASGGGEHLMFPEWTDTLYIGEINADGTISSWSTSTLPNSLIDHATVARNGWLYIIGGEDSFGVYYDSVYRAQINGDGSVGGWSVVSNMPEARIRHAVAVSNDQLYVIGGSNYSGAVSTVFNATMYPDGTFGPWHTNTPLPEPRQGHASVAYNQRLYAMGGYYDTVKDTVYYSDTLPPAENHPPNAPGNPSPADGATGVDLDPTLSVHVSDPNGDSMNVSFYDATGPTLIGTQNEVPSGGTASVQWTGLAESTTYSWYAVADDGEFTTQSPTWSFTTVLGNQPPNAPGNPVPGDGAAGIGLEPMLSVNVTDPDGDSMNVSFYDATGSTLIGTQSGVPSGGTASVQWFGLEDMTEYSWYAVSDDGEFTTQSPAWNFTTGDFTPPAPVTGLIVDHWGPGGGDETFTETRYMRSDNVLGLTQTTTEQQTLNEVTGAGGHTVNWGIRVWAGATEITGGTPVAHVSRNANGQGIQTGTWNCPETALTDDVTVTVYSQIDTAAWEPQGSFTTEALGSDWLDAVTWNVNYFTRYETVAGGPPAGRYTRAWFHWGAASADSRVENFQHYKGGGDPMDHNTLNWTHDGTDVDHYNIYRSDVQTGPWDAGAFIDSVPAGTYSYCDLDKGQADTVTWWYVVRAEDAAGNEEQNTNAVPEPGPERYFINLTGKPVGWVFVSYPLGISGNIQDILNDAAYGDGGTTWDVAKWYDGQTKTWKTHRKGSGVNTFTTINITMGVWLRLTANGGDQMLTTAPGTYHTSAVEINLYAGWNMVGYPSATSRLASSTLPAQATIVSVWKATSPFVQDYDKTEVTMEHGNAYWVYVTADCTWNVEP